MNEITIINDVSKQVATRDDGRAIEETRGAIIIAKKFPRNEIDALDGILKSCKRLSLAKVAMYSYPRGGQQITGASIHLLKTIARHWGNIQCGVRCLEQRDGESIIEAYAWDIETNYRPNRIFVVRHERNTKKNGIQKLSDPRDIYELEANMGARRLRSCLIDLIPRDVLDQAIECCEKTLETGDNLPLEQRIAKMLNLFSEVGVSKEMIENMLKHKLEAVNNQELLTLSKIYTSIKDGYAPREQYFDLEKVESQKITNLLNDKIINNSEKISQA